MDRFEFAPIASTEGASSPFFSPDGEWLGFVDYDDGKLKKVSVRGGAPVGLADVVGDFRGATWATDGWIYFSRSAESGIHRVPAEGGETEELTAPDSGQGEKTHRYPSVLPGGDALLFTLGDAQISSYDDAAIALLSLKTGEHRVLLEGGTSPRYVPTGHIVYARAGSLLAVPFDLDRLEVTGSPFRVVENVMTADGYGSAQYSFARDGTLAYVPGGPDHYHSGLFWVTFDGTVEPLPIEPESYGDIRVSPDGRRLALSILGANADVWIYELERGTMSRVTRSWDNYAPIWSRDGRLTYASNSGGSYGIYRTRAGGSGEGELLLGTGPSTYPASWSPDGRWLAYADFDPTTGFGVRFLAPHSNERSQPILDTPSHEIYPMFSPDGRWLAYVSDESGRSEVYVQRFEATGEKWQISTGGGDMPIWSPEGDELYYWALPRIPTAPN